MLNIGRKSFLYKFPNKSGIIKQNLKLYLSSHDPNSFSGSGTLWYDLSGNDYDATWNETMEYFYINSIDAAKDGKKAFFLKTDYAFPTTLNYGNGNTISEMSVFAWVKSYYNSGTTVGTWNSTNWAILDFDRSEVFTFALNGTGEVHMSGRSSNNGGIGGTYYDIVGTARMNDFRWHYIGWTFSVAEQKIVMYVDGQVDRTFTANGNMTALGAGLARWGVIGDGSERSSEVSTSRNNVTHKGYIGEIHFYDGKVLTPDEVLKNYDATKNVYSTEEGIVLDVNANNTSSYSGTGSTWNDISGKGNNVTLYGTTFQSATGGNPAYFHFDGNTGSYGKGPILPLVDSFSLDCWFRGSTSQPNDYCRLVARDKLGYFGNYALAGDEFSNYVRFGYKTFEALANTETSNSSVTGDLKGSKWVDYTGVVNFNNKDSSSYLYLYKNGTLISSVTDSGAGVNPATAVEGDGEISIANTFDGDNYSFSGDITSVRIHNKALSSTEVFNQFAEKALEVSGIVTDGLVLNLDAYFYHTSQGTTWYDLSGNSNNANLINGPSYNSPNDGYIRCDGTDDYMEVTDSSSLDFGTSDFTVEYWFRKLNVTTGLDNIWGVNKWNSGASNNTNEWALGIGDGNDGVGDNYTFGLEIGNGVYAVVHSPDELPVNTWYQLTGIRQGSNLKLYLNGELQIDNNTNGLTSGSSVNNVGRNLRIANSNGNFYYTNSDSSIVRAYNRALSDSEVMTNYKAARKRYGLIDTSDIIDDGLVLRLDASNSSSYPSFGNVWYDISGSGFTGEMKNGTTFDSENGGVMFFDGSDDHVDMGNILNSVVAGADKKFSVSCFFNPGSTGNKALVSKISDSNLGENQRQIALFARDIGNGYKITFSYYGTLNASSLRVFESTVGLSLNEWQEVTVTYDGSLDTNDGFDRVKMYLNGEAVGATMTFSTGSLLDIPSGTARFGIGSSVNTGGTGSFYNFDGKIGDVLFYDKVLTANEVKYNFEKLKEKYVPNVVRDGLVLYLDAANTKSYPGSGTTWYDMSGNRYHFTLGNAGAFQSSNGIKFMNFEGSYGVARRYVGSTLTDVPNYPNGTIMVFTSILNSTSAWRTLTRGAAADHHVLVGSPGNNNLGMWDNNGANFIDSGFDIPTLVNPYTEFNCLTFKLSQSSPYWQFKYNLDSTTYSITNANATFNNGFCSIGGYQSGPSQYWGKIGVFLYYNRHLTDAEIEQNYKAFSYRYGLDKIITNGLILNLDAGDYDSYSGSGTTWHDLSGNGNDFSMTGTLSFTDDGNSSYFTSTATTANYFIKNPFTHPTTTVTVEMWVVSDNASGEALYSYNASGQENNNLLFQTNNLTLYGPWGNVATGQNIADGNWKHIVRTSNRTTGQEILYINGTAVYTGTLAAGTNYTSGGAIALGQEQDGVATGFDPNQALEGKYSVFRIYDRVLNSTEISQNFNALRGRYGI